MRLRVIVSSWIMARNFSARPTYRKIWLRHVFRDRRWSLFCQSKFFRLCWGKRHSLYVLRSGGPNETVNLSGLNWPQTPGLRSRLVIDAVVFGEAVVTAVCIALSEVALLGVLIPAVVSKVSSSTGYRVSCWVIG